MKYKVIKCDICDKDITADDIRYKFKGYENSYCNYDDFEFNKWTKLDMCDDCFNLFKAYCEKFRKQSIEEDVNLV